jgi:hypothetical protein
MLKETTMAYSDLISIIFLQGLRKITKNFFGLSIYLEDLFYGWGILMDLIPLRELY